MKSLRQDDMKMEKVLGEFLDDYFYPYLQNNQKNIKLIKREKNIEEQRAGVDVCIELQDGKKIYIDEKASFYYSNAMIPTFAFEIDSIQKGYSPVIGWLLNDKLKTQYYLLVWPNVKCIENKETEVWERKTLNTLTKNDFTIIEAILINKEKLIVDIEKNVGSKDKLLHYAKMIRTKELKLTRNQHKINDSYKLFFSEYIYERPINLVINKRVLFNLAEAKFLISQDGCSVIK